MFRLLNSTSTCLSQLPGEKRQPSFPISSLFNTDTFLRCCRQKQFEAGDSRALLFNALCLRHKTGSFQTLEMLWADVRLLSPWQSQNILFNWISEMLMNIKRPDRMHFLLVSYLEQLAQERRKEWAQVSPTSNPPLACQGWEARVLKIHPANAIGLMLVGLKPAEPQNWKPSECSISGS